MQVQVDQRTATHGTSAVVALKEATMCRSGSWLGGHGKAEPAVRWMRSSAE